MEQQQYILINTEEMKPVVKPGLSSPKDALSYHDPRVQEYLASCFNGVFPSIVQAQEGLAYQMLGDSGRDRCSSSEPAQNIADIPRAEVLRLMEGWIRMRRRLQMDEGISSRVQSILLNFRVPDPKRAIQNYRIEKVGEQKRLIVLWGFESEEAPCISLERALSYLLEVPIGHLKSMLSTSMTPNTGAVTTTVKVDTAMINNLQNMDEDANNSTPVVVNQTNKLVIPMVAIAACMVAIVGYLGYQHFNKESAKDKVVRIEDRLSLDMKSPNPDDSSRSFLTTGNEVIEEVVMDSADTVSPLDETDAVAKKENVSDTQKVEQATPIEEAAEEQKEAPQVVKVEAEEKVDLMSSMLGEKEKRKESQSLLSTMLSTKVSESGDQKPKETESLLDEMAGKKKKNSLMNSMSK